MTAHVSRFEWDDRGDRVAEATVEVVRAGRWPYPAPEADDVPADVRAALLEWLSAPVSGLVVDTDLEDVWTVLRAGAGALRSAGEPNTGRQLDRLADQLEAGSALLHRIGEP